MKAVSSLFGGGKVKRDKRLEALQRRQAQQTQSDRAKLEADKADVAGSASRVRSGRTLLSYVRNRGRARLGV